MIFQIFREMVATEFLCNTEYIHVQNKSTIYIILRNTVFSSSPVSLHDANLIGPYEDNLQTVSYNTSTPYLFFGYMYVDV